MAERVVAVDPGGRSGWASAEMSADRFEYAGGGVLRMDLMADWLAAQQQVMYVDDLNAGRAARAYDVVVYESWKPRRDEHGRLDWLEGDDLVNSQHVGQVRWIALTSGARLVEQHPSDKPMAVATMPRVLACLDRDSNEQHDRDARMHLWLYFWREWFSGDLTKIKVIL